MYRKIKKEAEKFQTTYKLNDKNDIIGSNCTMRRSN